MEAYDYSHFCNFESLSKIENVRFGCCDSLGINYPFAHECYLEIKEINFLEDQGDEFPFFFIAYNSLLMSFSSG